MILLSNQSRAEDEALPVEMLLTCPSPQQLHRVLEILQRSHLWVTYRCAQGRHGVDDVRRQSVEIQSSVIHFLLDQIHVQNLVQLRPQSDVSGQQQGLEHLTERDAKFS